MSYSNKTPNLNLPQWVGTEKPERTDFNAAFNAIDTTVASQKSVEAKNSLILANGWYSDSAETYGLARYNKDRKRTYLYGLANGESATNNYLANLPYAYRPPQQTRVDITDSYGVIISVTGNIIVTPSNYRGVVNLFGVSFESNLF